MNCDICHHDSREHGDKGCGHELHPDTSFDEICPCKLTRNDIEHFGVTQHRHTWRILPSTMTVSGEMCALCTDPDCAATMNEAQIVAYLNVNV